MISYCKHKQLQCKITSLSHNHICTNILLIFILAICYDNFSLSYKEPIQNYQKIIAEPLNMQPFFHKPFLFIGTFRDTEIFCSFTPCNKI